MNSNLNPSGLKIFPATEDGTIYLEVRQPEGRMIDQVTLSLEEGKELLAELGMAVKAAEANEDHQASWIRNKQFAKA